MMLVSHETGKTVMTKQISIIIPAFEEAMTVGCVVEAVRGIDDLDAEIIVVDDASSDATAQTARDAGADRVISHHRNRGYGASIKTGVKAATRDIIVTMDADGQHAAKDIPKLLGELKPGTDMVIGDRSGFEPVTRRTPGKWILKKVAEFLACEPIADLKLSKAMTM